MDRPAQIPLARLRKELESQADIEWERLRTCSTEELPKIQGRLNCLLELLDRIV